MDKNRTKGKIFQVNIGLMGTACVLVQVDLWLSCGLRPRVHLLP
jgi:hypothetical protein